MMKKHLFLYLFIVLCLINSLGLSWAQIPAITSAGKVDLPNEWKTPDNDNSNADGVLRLSKTIRSTHWLSQPLDFESRNVYRSSFKLAQNGASSSGCVCCGTDFFNYDYYLLEEEDVPTKDYSVYFFVPDGENGKRPSSVRFAKWESERGFVSSIPEIAAVQPIFKLLKNEQNEVLTLGEGESIGKDGLYRFSIFSSPVKTNYDRPLFSTTSSFNTDRWGVTNESTLVYRFALEPLLSTDSGVVKTQPIPFLSGNINVHVGHRVSGTLEVEASTDLKNWIKVGEISQVSTKDFSLNSFLDNKPTEFFIRFRGIEDESKSCNLQIYRFAVELQTAQDTNRSFEGVGSTWFAENVIETSPSSNALDAVLWGFDEDNSVWVIDNNHRSHKLDWDSGLLERIADSNAVSEMNSGAPLEIQYMVNLIKPMVLVRRVFPYFEQNYTIGCGGMTLKDEDGVGADLSWCLADYHVPRNPNTRIVQEASKPTMNCGKNDFESLQLVCHAEDKPLLDVQARMDGDLVNVNGARISLENVQVRYAYYHFVSQPTDSTCAIGWYPDALIPFEQGSDGQGGVLNIEPNCNFLVWVTVKVDSDVEPGVYDGVVTITANKGRFEATVPFTLNVFDCILPEKNTLDTAYGLSYSNINNYHNLKTEEDKRLVYEKYLKIFSDYRISMYDPTPLDQIKVEWRPDANPPCCKLDFDAFDKECKRVFEKYHFTNFSLPFRGLGGGTYQSRYTGSIAGYDADSYEYNAMLADYGHKMQEHLHEIGVLDSAYIYCFDEPEEKDYEFVAGEFAKLKKYAPEIKRMLTEEPSVEFSKILKDKGASIDLWCPVSPNYSESSAKSERSEGNRFWWYVCCFPKAPYCTEFTDHPAIELRLWHWQSFERDITGCLIWSGNYWTSPTAFPDSFQNPYEDPACYVTDGSFAPGAKSLWGNGDGRFIYPPLSAATPGRNDGKPIYDAPNASVRWEMIREGVEDYEMLSMLRKLLKEKSSRLTTSKAKKYEELFDFSSFTKDMTHFNVDPLPLHTRRQLVMSAIVELQKL